MQEFRNNPDSFVKRRAARRRSRDQRDHARAKATVRLLRNAVVVRSIVALARCCVHARLQMREMKRAPGRQKGSCARRLLQIVLLSSHGAGLDRFDSERLSLLLVLLLQRGKLGLAHGVELDGRGMLRETIRMLKQTRQIEQSGRHDEKRANATDSTAHNSSNITALRPAPPPPLPASPSSCLT